MTEKDKIEKIFEEKLGDFQKMPSENVWKNINRKLFLKRFLRYNPLSVNIWNILLVTSIAISAVVFGTSKSNTNKNPVNKTITENINLNTAKNDIKSKTSDNSNKNKIKNIKNNTTNENISIKKTNKKQDKTKNNNITGDDKILSIDVSEKENDNTKSNNEERLNVKLAQPRCDFSVNTESTCEPAEIKLVNKSENFDSFLWDFGNGKTSKEKNPAYVFNTAGEYKITLTVKSGSFSDTKSVTVKIFPKPFASIEIKENKKRLFTGDKITFLNNGTGYTGSIWNFGDNNTSSYTNPEHIYEKEGIYKISLVCINEYKCADTAKINDLVIQDSKYKIRFPTAFSPDKNGQNNGYWKSNPYSNTIFHPVYNEYISEYNLTIYNKYGAVIFVSNNPEIGWDGFYENSPVPAGVYVWKCSGKYEDGKTFNETGNVTLLYLKNR